MSAPTAAPGQPAVQRATFCRGAAPEYEEVEYGEDMGAGGKIPINELVVGQIYQGTVVRLSLVYHIPTYTGGDVACA